MKPAERAFEGKTISLELERLVPTKTYKAGTKYGPKFSSILKSVEEIGIVEPLVVYPETPSSPKTTKYLVLDGNVRLEALRRLGGQSAVCLVAREDESFTYNRHVNHIGPVQENRMIQAAINKGLSPERIAAVLCVDVKRVHKRRALLDGIAPEAIRLLKDQLIGAKVFDILRKMRPMRQIETAELMRAAGRYSTPYVEMIYLSSAPEMLVGKKLPTKQTAPSAEDISLMEREMTKLRERYHGLEDTSGDAMLKLVVVSGYLRRLLQNDAILTFIKRHHGDLIDSLSSVLESVTSESKRLKRE